MARKSKTKRKAPQAEAAREGWLRPTDERLAHNDTESAGPAVRFIPVILNLRRRDLLTEKQFEALAYYRDQALLADHSPVRSGMDFTPRGGGHGPGVAILSAKLEAGRIEREMGGLMALAREVVVGDRKIEMLAMERITSAKLQRMTLEDAKDEMAKVMAMLLLELRFAAGRVGMKSN